MCGTNAEDAPEREKFHDAIKSGKQIAAATLAGILVSSLGIAPAIAAVVGAITVKLFFDPAQETICDLWGKKLSSKPN